MVDYLWGLAIRVTLGLLDLWPFTQTEAEDGGGGKGARAIMRNTHVDYFLGESYWVIVKFSLLCSDGNM